MEQDSPLVTIRGGISPGFEKRILVGFSVVVLALLTLSGTSYFTIRALHRSKNIFVSPLGREVLEYHELRYSFENVVARNRGYIFSGHYLFEREAREGREDFLNHLGKLRAEYHNADSQIYFAELLAAEDEYNDAAKIAFQMKKRGVHPEKILDYFDHVLRPRREKVSAVLYKTLDEKSEELVKRLEEYEKEEEDVGRFLFYMSLSVFVLGIGLTLLIRRTLRNVRCEMQERERLEEENLSLLIKEKTARELAEMAVKGRDEFISIASHELKTPLTSIKLQMQLFKRSISKGTSQAYSKKNVDAMVSLSERQVNKLTRLIDDMLDVSRIRSGHLTYKPEEFDLVQLLGRCLEDLNEQAKDQQLPAPEMVTCESALVRLDPVRTEQVFINLLTNALRYGEHRPVNIRLEKTKDSVLLSVQDHGLGIPKDKQDIIFNRFERSLHANEMGGLGLGLFISKNIVKAQGGRIWVESEPGQGSTFFVEFPLADANAQH